MKNIPMVTLFLLLLVAIINMPAQVRAATYLIPTSTTTVDGGSYCGGKACSGGDVLIIQGGSRVGLRLMNFNGEGQYITVTNENTNPDRPVALDQGPKDGYAILSIANCKWLNLTGDNDPDLEYGIRVNNGVVARSAAIHVYGRSEHVKIGYTEVSFDGNTGTAGTGIRVQDSSLTNKWIFDDFEIHHNYIHDVKYAGMYLGHNDPHSENNPYTAHFSVHHNTITNSGAYGLTLKGMMGPGASYVYGNVIDTAGYGRTDLGDYAKQGIGTHMHYNGSYLKIYENTVVNTVGAGVKIGVNYTATSHEVYDNQILRCGTGNHKIHGNGIVVMKGVNATIYNNMIISVGQYGAINSLRLLLWD